MMVHDDDVALHRPTVHLGDKALVPRAALLTQTGVSASIELMPERARLGQRRQLRAVAAGCVFFPRRNCAVLLDLIQSVQHWLSGQVVKFFSTQIIVATLHVTHAE